MPQAVGILSLIGTGVSAVTQYQAGQDAKAIGRNNAILQENNAQEALKTGVIQQNQYRRQLNQFLGRQRATIAANNVQDLGSPLSLQEDAAATGETDIANIRNQAALDAYGFKVGASDSISRGNAAARTGTANAFGELLKAGGTAYGMYADYSAGQKKSKPATAKPILGGYRQANGSGY